MPFPARFRRACLVPVLALSLAAGLGACASTDQDASTVDERPVTALYNGAADALDAGEYRQAAQAFDTVERQHPYSIWASRAQLMAAYAHYKALRYDETLAALDRFIQLHPGSDDIDYAHYLQALSYYEQISDVGRDQRMTRLARDSLAELVRRFPDSRYARDARLKLDLTRDHLAGKEMEVGRWYLRRGQYSAAISRFTQVIEGYQTTSHVPEALLRLTEAYLALGVEAEARRAAATLGHNYPGSDWYQSAYALLVDGAQAPPGESKNWLTRAIDPLF